MTPWLSRRRPLGELPRLKPRVDRKPATKVDLAQIAPEPLSYLGQAAYLQLELFQVLSEVTAQLPDLAAREAISAAAGLALAKHQGLTAEIARHGAEPAVVMQPFATRIDGFRALTKGADWCETLLAAYVTAGLLDDFFIRLAEGLPTDVGPRAAQLLRSDAGQATIVRILSAEIEADPRLGSRLAMWGRRLVGDTLLIARSALHVAPGSDEERIEPVFTEVIAAHTRRMDVLGLTA